MADVEFGVVVIATCLALMFVELVTVLVMEVLVVEVAVE